MKKLKDDNKYFYDGSIIESNNGERFEGIGEFKVIILRKQEL